MVVKGIRYGETWGMGCGPVFGPTFVEVMACDKEGNSTFVVASILESDLKINISDYPLFDIVHGAFDGNVPAFEAEMDKVAKLYKTDDDYDVYDEEENGYGHYYPGLEKVVDLAVLILKECGDGEVKETYLGEDLDKLDVPCGPYYEEEDEE
ncbi:MAG: hypothetical protein ACI4NB_06480 [Candidatus Ornithospirochaeta sp.]